MVKTLLDQNLDRYVISDVAYKPGCPVDIIEESQPIEAAKRLVRAGKRVASRDRATIIASKSPPVSTLRQPLRKAPTLLSAPHFIIAISKLFLRRLRAPPHLYCDMVTK